MAGKSKVWFVDDLPRNLEKFAKNHAADFDVTTFLSTDAVLKRIVRGDLPDAMSSFTIRLRKQNGLKEK